MGLWIIYCPDDGLFLRFHDLYIRYIVRNRNLGVLKVNIYLEDIVDEGKILEVIESEHLRNNHREEMKYSQK